MSDDSTSWTKDIEDTLERLRIVCLVRSKYHKNNYYKMLNLLKYFRIPIIILSALNSVFNVALTTFMSQITISLLCCFISLCAGLIGSIELFLQIQTNMENDLLNAKEYYLNAIDIYKILQLDRKNRNHNARAYLDEKFSIYSKLVESAVVIDKDLDNDVVSLNLIQDLSLEEKIKIINENVPINTIISLRKQSENEKYRYSNPNSPLNITKRFLNISTKSSDDGNIIFNKINKKKNSDSVNTSDSNPSIDIEMNIQKKSNEYSYSNFFDKIDDEFNSIMNNNFDISSNRSKNFIKYDKN
jgi:hypothetical protein